MKVAYTVGRFQPPTIGHKMLIQKTIEAAGEGGQAYVFVSKTVNNTDSPLPIALKLPILRHMFEHATNVKFVDTSTECTKPCGGPGPAFGHLLEKGFTPEQITFVIGMERLGDPTSPKYFGPEARLWGDETKPRPGKFQSVGQNVYRDPSLEDKSAENMSGTKAREYACRQRKPDFYTALGYDYAAGKVDVVEAAYTEIRNVICGAVSGVKTSASTLEAPQPKKSKRGGGEEDEATKGGPDGERPIDTVKFVNEGTTYDLPIVVLSNTRLFRGIGKEPVDCATIDPSQGELPYVWMSTDPQLARKYGNCVFQYEPTKGKPLRLLDIWSPTVIRLIDSISPGFTPDSKRAWFRDYTGRTSTKSQDVPTVQKIGPIGGGPTEKVNALTIFDESYFTNEGTALVWRGLTWGDERGQFSRYSVADSDAWVTSLMFQIVNTTGLDGLYAPILPSHFHNGTSIQNVFDEEFIVLKSSLASKYTISSTQGGKRRKTRRNHKKSRFMSSKRMKGQY